MRILNIWHSVRRLSGLLFMGLRSLNYFILEPACSTFANGAVTDLKVLKQPKFLKVTCLPIFRYFGTAKCYALDLKNSKPVNISINMISALLKSYVSNLSYNYYLPNSEKIPVAFCTWNKAREPNHVCLCVGYNGRHCVAISGLFLSCPKWAV